jgi:hypothetical protein
MSIARAAADERLRCDGLGVLGWVNVRRGDDDRVLELSGEGLDVARRLGDKHRTGEFLNLRGSSPSIALEERVRMCEESLGLFETVGDRVMSSRVLGNLAYLQMAEGDSAAACRRLREAMQLLRVIGDERGLALNMCNLGFALFLDGATAKAQAVFDEQLRVSRRQGDLALVAYGNLGHALLASRNGDCEQAAELHGVADGIHETLGTHVEGVESQAREADIAALRATLGDATFEAAYSAGRMRSVEATFAHALDPNPGTVSL